MDLSEIVRRFEAEGLKPEVWAHEGSWILHQRGFVDGLDATLLDSILAWKQDSIQIFGRSIPLPRLTAWYGDDGAEYFYSGIRNQPTAWIPELQVLRTKLAALGLSFNSALANRYADGSQHQGYHADDEKELGHQPLIASLSFGGTRRFLIKSRSKKTAAIPFDLENGSLLLMGGRLQKDFIHALAKTQKPVDLRINLTFRMIYNRP